MSELFVAFVFLFIAILCCLPAFFIMRGHKVRIQKMKSGQINVQAHFKYIQGVDAFQTTAITSLELLHDQVVMTQQKRTPISIPYSSITEVSEECIQQMVRKIERNRVLDQNKYVNHLKTDICLVIRHRAENEQIKAIYLQKLGTIEDFTFFRQEFQAKLSPQAVETP